MLAEIGLDLTGVRATWLAFQYKKRCIMCIYVYIYISKLQAMRLTRARGLFLRPRLNKQREMANRPSMVSDAAGVCWHIPSGTTGST